MKSDLYLGPKEGLAVDASCIDSHGTKKRDGYFHGRCEWQGIDIDTGEVILQSHVQQQSTINIAEFCAIVHGLQYFYERGIDLPVYSDSKIAIWRVKSRSTSTRLPRNQHTASALYDLDQSLRWLNQHKPKNPVIWWRKYEWGPMPADFGRK